MIMWMTVISGLTELGRTVFKHWRVVAAVTWVMMFAYIVLWCIPKHGSHTCTEARRDTIYLPADTTVHVLPDIVPKPIKTHPNPHTPKFEPIGTVIPEAVDCSDSVKSYVSIILKQDAMISKCDSLLADASAIRSYSDSTTDGLLTIFGKASARGRLDLLRLSYRDDRPQMVIRETTEVPTPTRSIFVGVGAGPDFLVEENQLESLRITAELGYKTKNGHGIGVDGSYSTSNRWFIGAKYVKHFQF